MTIDGIPYALVGQKATLFALLWNARGKPVSCPIMLSTLYDPRGDQPLWALHVLRVQIWSLRRALAATRFSILATPLGYRMVRACP